MKNLLMYGALAVGVGMIMMAEVLVFQYPRDPKLPGFGILPESLVVGGVVIIAAVAFLYWHQQKLQAKKHK